MRHWHRPLLALAALIFAATCWADPEEAPEIRYTALINATLIDGRGNPHQENHTLLIAGDSIDSIFPDGDRPIPQQATVLDMQDKHILPGLIDAHVHLATDPENGESVADVVPKLGRYLYGGVTTVRDMGGDTRVLGYLARQALLEQIDSPDIFYSAIIGGPEFFTDPRTVSSAKGFSAGTTPWMRAVDQRSDLAVILSQAKGNGVTGIKIYRHLPEQLIAPLASEAGRQGLQSWAHLDVEPAEPQSIAEAGVTAVSHAAYFLGRSREEQQRWQEGPAYTSTMAKTGSARKLAQTLAEQDVILDATLLIFARGASDGESHYYDNADRAGVDFTRLAHEAGVRIATGTDQGIDADDDQPPVHEEMALLVERAGLSPLQAIQAASSHGASLLGKEAEFGAIAPGLKANLLVLNTDPLEDIRNTRDIAHVIKNGRFVYLGMENMALPFAEARELDGQLLLSGQLGNIPGTFTLVKGGVAAETEQTLRNIEGVLRRHGLDRDDVRKCTAMLADIEEWGQVNEVYSSYFHRQPRPARSAFASAGLALGARIELECIAEL